MSGRLTLLLAGMLVLCALSLVNAQYQARRDVLYKGLTEAGWPVDKPKASMYIWARIPEHYRAMGRIVGDPLPYGIEANRASIEAMMTYCHQQGLLKKQYSIDDMFINPGV